MPCGVASVLHRPRSRRHRVRPREAIPPKRIRLRVAVPGFRPGDAEYLAQKLSAPIVHGSERGPAWGFTPTSPAGQAEETVRNAAAKIARSGHGQGFQLDQDVKVAVEAHAMNMATKFYSVGWKVEDVHGTESYDLMCRRGDVIKHVEVKGTITHGAEVILTPNEVRHAREYPCTALFVLSNVTVERAEDGTITATGGKEHIYDPWRLEEGTLTPLGFRYEVPPM
jgi:hypothetical protein